MAGLPRVVDDQQDGKEEEEEEEEEEARRGRGSGRRKRRRTSIYDVSVCMYAGGRRRRSLAAGRPILPALRTRGRKTTRTRATKTEKWPANAPLLSPFFLR
jgi:hypothetical protein